VKQHLGVGRGVEIEELPAEIEVGQEGRHEGNAAAQGHDVQGAQENRSQQDEYGDQEKQRRQNPQRAAAVEVRYRKPALGELALKDGGDQIAGYDEEDIDPDEAAGQGCHTEMVEYDGEHGYGAQPIDVGPISDWRQTRSPQTQASIPV